MNVNYYMKYKFNITITYISIIQFSISNVGFRMILDESSDKEPDTPFSNTLHYININIIKDNQT